MEQPDGRKGKPSRTCRSMPARVSPVMARNFRSKRNSLRWYPTKSRTVRTALSLVRRSPRPSCWRKIGRALGRSQKQDRVGVRDVEAFVEQVSCEQDVDVPGAQIRQRLLSFGARRRSADRAGGDSGFVEDTRHVLGVGDADAEAKGPHGTNVGDLVSELPQHDASACVVAGEEVVELGLVVAATGPGQCAQVRPVCGDEVVEGTEQVCAQARPTSRSSAAVRPSKNERTSMPSARSGVAVRP